MFVSFHNSELATSQRVAVEYRDTQHIPARYQFTSRRVSYATRETADREIAHRRIIWLDGPTG